MYQFGISPCAATGIHGFEPAVASLRMKGVRCLNGITSNTIWTSPPQLCMEKVIAVQLPLPTSMDLLCNNLLVLTTQLFDVRTLSTLLAGIVASEPAFIFYKMSDPALKACYHLHHMIPVLGFAQILHIWSPHYLLRGSCLGVSANHIAQPNKKHRT